MSAEDRQAIDERAELIEARARALATAAVDAGAPWARRLGTAADRAEGHANRGWTRQRQSPRTATATRSTSDLPTGGGSSNDAQRADRRRAQWAARQAARLATGADNDRRVSIPARAISIP